MEAALELLREFDAAGRRIVVCGDMGELGEQSLALHWQLGKQIVEIGGAEVLIACGQFARHVVAGGPAGRHAPAAVPIACETVDDALPYLGQAMLPGDVVLVKGSRMMAMERMHRGPGTISATPQCIDLEHIVTKIQYEGVSSFASGLREFDATLPSLGRSN